MSIKIPSIRELINMVKESSQNIPLTESLSEYLHAIMELNDIIYGPTGIRVDDENYNIGDFVEDSRVWADNELTDEILDGVSTIGLNFDGSYIKESNAVRALKLLEKYSGDHIYVICGKTFSWGEDEDEMVIKNGRVIAILA